MFDAKRSFAVAAVVVAAYAASALSAACGKFSEDADSPVDAGLTVEGGADALVGTPDGEAPPVNPYGVPYPTEDIGTHVRSGSERGSIIANLRFSGYVPGASTTSRVQMADLYDPEGRTHDIVALLLASTYGMPSIDMTYSLHQTGLPPRVDVVLILGSASLQQGAKLEDLAMWRAAIDLPQAWALLDSRFSQFPTVSRDLNGTPTIILLDARTMEIVSVRTGYTEPPVLRRQLEDVQTEVKGRPAAY